MATRVWTGGATNIAQIDRVTFSGTWGENDTVTLTIGAIELVVTLHSLTSTNDVASMIAAAVNAINATDGVVDDETRNVGGQEIPQFTELAAAATTNYVLFTGVAGVPFTMTVTENSPYGSLTKTTTQSATGTNHFDAPDNWTGNVVPSSSDKIVFQNSSIDCLYALSQSAIINTLIQVDASYTGRIGLPKRNARGYTEYRQRHLHIKCQQQERAVVIGEGPGSGSSRLNFNFDDSEPYVLIMRTAPREAEAKAAVDILATGTDMDVDVRRGSVSFAADSQNSCVVNDLKMSYVDSVETDADVYVGDNVTLKSITQRGGHVLVVNSPSTATMTTMTCYAGVIEYNGRGVLTNMYLYGGTVYWNSTGAITTIRLSGNAILDFSHDLREKTVVNPVERFSATSQFRDPMKVVNASSTLIIDNNQIADTDNLDLGTDIRITRGVTA